MAVVTRVEPIESTIALTVDRNLSPAAQRKSIAAFAREKLKDAQNRNERALGRVPPHETFVDGRRDASLDSVSPEGGVIVFEFEMIGESLMWILETLRDRSPVISGAYRRGHKLFADGREIAAPTKATLAQADEFVFTNTVPYARKIEIGRTESGRAFVVQVPNRIYERTAEDAQRRFGNIVRVKFSYRSPILSYGGAASRRGGLERATRAPAIVVTPR